LQFNPANLKGLSEKLIVSHHQNNYGGAVRRLNQIQQQIGGLPKDAQPYQMGSLKREEIVATNSMILHEFYFGNLGGDGKSSGTISKLINGHYGSVATWEQDFRRTGMSLGGGSGWVILNYSYRDNVVHNYWAADHTNSAPGECRYWLWTCMNMLTPWIMEQMRPAISMPSSKTLIG
jgi:superoxide dismutase, Fe-Mn family